MFERDSVSVLIALVAVSSVLWAAGAAAGAPRFPDSAYVRARDGNLYLGDERVRYWGYIGWPLPNAVDPNDPDRRAKIDKVRRTVDLMVERIHDLGFNLVRNWYSHHSADYEPGDGSHDDIVAYYFWKLDQRGIKLWESALNDMGQFGPDDVAAIRDPTTAAEWRAGVEEIVKKERGRNPNIRSHWGAQLRAVDPRMRKLAQERMKRVARWPNHYKGGLALADDPQVVVWELSNEEFLFRPLFYGHWQDLPAFFRNALISKWNAFLVGKYGTREKLEEAWRFLMEGEDPARGTVMLAPLANPVSAETAINDANPAIIASLKVAKQRYTRDDFTRRRGEDVLEFLTKLIIDYKQSDHDELKTWGRSCAISPLVWDSGDAFQIQGAFMHQHADAVSTCAYVKGMAHDPTYKRFPFWSSLEAPPRMCWDVPWMEQSSVVGKPQFVYETQIDCRTKYRAEFPVRIAAIAAIQDWDIVNWHIYGHSADPDKERPFDGMIHVWHDYLGYGNDEVQCSAMKACAEIFKNGLLAPAPKPTEFVFGRRTLYDPASMDYGRSYGDYGKMFIPTCFRYGARVRIDPAREDDEIVGPSYRQGVFEPNPIRPTDEIEYDWNRGHIRFDSPRAVGYTGFLGQYGEDNVEFANGASFSKIEIRNPEGMPYPVSPEEGYVSVTLASADGQDLSRARRAVLSAVSTSFNSDYSLDLTKSAQGMHQAGPLNVPPREFWGAWANAGKEPVLVARVGVTVECRAIDGMSYVMRDWHMNEVGRGRVRGGRLAVPADRPVFVVELER